MLRFLLLSCLILTLGCGGDASKEKPKVVVAPKEKVAEKKEEPKKAEPKLTEVDLSLYEIRGAISLPEPVEIAFSYDRSWPRSVELQFGGNTVLVGEITGKEFGKDFRKPLLDESPKAKLLIDEPDTLLIQRPDREKEALALLHRSKTEGGEYYFRCLGEAGEEAGLKRILGYLRSFRYTPEMKEQDAVVLALRDEVNRKRLHLHDLPGRGIEVGRVRLSEDESEPFRLSAATRQLSLSLHGKAGCTPAELQRFLERTELRSLSLSYQENADSWLESTRGAKGIREIKIESSHLTAAGLTRLKDIPGLRSLHLSDLDALDDDALSKLAVLPDLAELRISSIKLTDGGLGFLKAMSRLRGLILSDSHVTDQGLTQLTGLTSLRYLSLNRNRINGSGFAYLRGMTGLQELTLSYTDITDRAIERLRFPDMRVLSLTSTSITDEGLTALKAMPKLEMLFLDATAVSDAGLKHLTTLTDLTRLGLRACRIRGNGLKQLESLPRLDHLDLSINPLLDGELPEFGKFPACYLSLSSTGLTNAAVKKLAGFRGEVNLLYTQVDRVGFQALGKEAPTLPDELPEPEAAVPAPESPPEPKLPPDPAKLYAKYDRHPTLDENDPDRPVIALDFSGTRLTDLDLAELRELPKLRSLKLSRTEVSGPGLKYLASLTTLRELNLYGTPLKPNTLAFLTPLANLEQLTLPDFKLTRKQLEPLAALKNITEAGKPRHTDELDWMSVATRWPNLTELEVGNNSLLETVAGMSSLRHLRIVPEPIDSPIGNAGLFVLKSLKELRSLDIHCVALSDPGMVYINGLHELTSLRIFDAPIGDAGMNQIKGAFKLSQLRIDNGYQLTDKAAADIRDLPSMAELTVKDAKFTDKGFELLCELKDLEHLNLPGAKNLTDAIWPFAKKLEELRTLDVSGSKVTGKGIDSISELSRLRSLNFADTQLNDEALTYLRRLPGLIEINLKGTKVSDAAVKEFQAARPKVKVTR